MNSEELYLLAGKQVRNGEWAEEYAEAAWLRRVVDAVVAEVRAEHRPEMSVTLVANDPAIVPLVEAMNLRLQRTQARRLAREGKPLALADVKEMEKDPTVSANPKVRPGQVWADKRYESRRVRVERMDSRWVYAYSWYVSEPLSGRNTRIEIERLRKRFTFVCGLTDD